MLGTMEQRTKGMKKQAQELIEQAYNRGFKAGYEEGKGQAWSEEVKKYEIEPDKKNEYIEQGRNDAWETIIKILEKPWPERRKALKSECYVLYDMLLSISASEAIEKLRAYEEQKKQEEEQEIRVGDEVYTEDKEIKFVVTRISEESAHLVDFKGNFAWTKTYCLHKTGRHFPEIENVLGKLKEVNNG